MTLQTIIHIIKVTIFKIKTTRGCKNCKKYICFDTFKGTSKEYYDATPGCHGCLQRVYTRWEKCNPPKPYQEDDPCEE